MATISIWGRYRGNVEKIDSASSKSSADYLVGEYRMAFGKEWEIWAGRKDQQETQRKQQRGGYYQTYGYHGGPR